MMALGVIIPMLPKLVESFVDNDTAERGADLRPVRHRLGADAVFLLADVRRAVGPVRPAAGRAAVEFRAGVRLRADGAGAVAGLAVSRPGDLRHHFGQRLDGVRLYRRRHAAGEARRGVRHDRRCVRRRTSFWAPRSAACSAASIRGCRSGSRRDFSFANALYGFFILPESLPRDRRAPFRWKSANPGRRAAAAALEPWAGWAVGGQFLSRSSRMWCCPRLRALRGLSLWLGRDDGRHHARDGRCLLDGGAGRC